MAVGHHMDFSAQAPATGADSLIGAFFFPSEAC